MKTKEEALKALRNAMVDYLVVLELMGTFLGGPTEDFYDEDGSVPVCDFWNGSESFEISVGPLELAEQHRSLEKNRGIAAWKEGKFDSVEAWNLYAETRQIQE